MTSRNFTFLLCFLISVFSKCLAQDYVFTSFPSENIVDSIMFFSDADLLENKHVEFQKQINSRKIPAEYLKESFYEIKANCTSEMGLFLKVEKFDLNAPISINSEVRYSNSYQLDLQKWFDKSKKENTGLLFINLSKFLNNYFFIDTSIDSLLCCPSDKEERKTDFCSILELKEGLQIILNKNSGNKIKFNFLPKGNGNGNGNVPEVEPRQYITIYERKYLQSEANPVWWLNKKEDPLKKNEVDNENLNVQKFYPNQKYSSISTTSLLEVRFDQEALANNIDFFGNISLTAKAGSKKVEVSPYYVIGEEQKSYGVNAIPIKDIAEHFIRLMIEAKKSYYIYEWGVTSEIEDLKKLKTSDVYDRKDEKGELILSAFKNNLQHLKSRAKSVNTDKIFYETNVLLDLADLLGAKGKEARMLYYNSLNLSIDEKKVILDSLEIRLDKKKLNDAEIRRYYPLFYSNLDFHPNNKDARNYEEFILHTMRCKDILSLIKESGEETTEAFLSFTSLTNLDYENILLILNQNLERLKGFEKKQSIKDSTITISKLEEIEFTLFNLKNIAGEISNSGIIFHNLLEKRGYDKFLLKYRSRKEIQEDSTVVGYSNHPNDLDTWMHQLNYSRNSFINNLSVFNDVKRELALIAGSELFKRMVYATIDIRNSGLEDGDVLEVSLIWNRSGSNNLRRDEKEKSDGIVELSTAKFLIKKMGWFLEPSETALLINRIDEEHLDINYPMSPSNFKPTAGASLLWSYYNDYRTKSNQKFLKVLKWLEPSFGINVSYCDFRTDKDFEVGFGPTMGLWNNKIFLTSGYNLSVQGESPFYLGIGFSFLNVFNSIKEKL